MARRPPESPARTGRPAAPRGRGAVSNRAGRFERREIVPVDPGDSAATEPGPAHTALVRRDEDEVPALPTTVIVDATRTIFATNDSPDVPFDRSINPYRGCEHGCSYCFARPSHAYLGYSSGLDFETMIVAKPDAADLLRKELARPRYRCEPIAIGTNTDPYQPVERRLRITRAILEVLAEHRHPVSVVTKSALVLRDLDLLAQLATEGLTKVFLSVTTLDGDLARRMEPRAASPGRRLATLEALSRSGVPTGVLASPMIPGLNDHELESILEASAARGAHEAAYILVRLPHDLKELFEEWLREQYPTRAAKVLSLVKAAHGGNLYDPGFGERITGRGPYADLLRRRFDVACRRLGLNERDLALDKSRFRPPNRLL